MAPKRKLIAGIFCALLITGGGYAQVSNCNGLPTQFKGNEYPKGDFFSNFNTPCYTISFATGQGGQSGSDLNSVYYKMYFKVDPRYQIVVLGSFPNSRYFAVTAYDEHSAISQSLADVNIVPLTSQYINPYLPGISFLAKQQYAVPVDFGGTPGVIESGCKMDGYNADVNKLDAARRHQGMDWNSDSGFFNKNPGAVYHNVDTPGHSNPNKAGVLMIRSFLDMSPPGSAPMVVVRDVASGCAYPATYALNTLKIVTHDSSTGNSWLDSAQAKAHLFYELDYLPNLCYAPDPQNMVTWAREPEYVSLINPDSSYTNAPVPSGLPATLAASGQVMRIRLRLPTSPPTPCSAGCSRSGSEQLRYMSLSFQDPSGNTFASMPDRSFITDANGYATMIVGTGATIPSWITPSHGYTFLNLKAISGYQQLAWLFLRDILPSSGFNCSGQILPFGSAENTPAGGLMGEYLPVVDYPYAATLAQNASAYTQSNSCAVFPIGQPRSSPKCGVVASPAITISSAVTQCAAPHCDQFVVQSQPPVTITGSGFGSLPDGLPYSGTSAYLQIVNLTRNWSTGHTGDACMVSIDKWALNRISLQANINQDGLCPLAAGDQLTVTVWNPQTMTSATFALTVDAQTSQLPLK